MPEYGSRALLRSSCATGSSCRPVSFRSAAYARTSCSRRASRTSRGRRAGTCRAGSTDTCLRRPPGVSSCGRGFSGARSVMSVMPYIGSMPIALVGRHEVRGVVHAERIEDVLLHQFVDAAARRLFADVREHVGGNAVAQLAAGLERDRLFGETPHHFVERHAAVAADFRALVVLGDLTAGNELVRETGAMRQQILDGDRSLRRSQSNRRRRAPSSARSVCRTAAACRTGAACLVRSGSARSPT